MAVKYNILFAVFVTLLCTHLTTSAPLGCQLTINGGPVSIQCRCDNYAPIGSNVVWYRNGEVVTEVEGATIMGTTVTFSNPSPSMEADWTCKANGATSEPWTVLVPPSATDTDETLVRGQVSTFPSGIQVGPRTRELCRYQIIVDNLSCDGGIKTLNTLLDHQHTPGDTVQQVNISVNSSLKIDTGSFNLTYEPSEDEDVDMMCLSVSIEKIGGQLCQMQSGTAISIVTLTFESETPAYTSTEAPATEAPATETPATSTESPPTESTLLWFLRIIEKIQAELSPLLD